MNLVPVDVFFLAACMAYRDGRVETEETELLVRLRKLFRLDWITAADAMERARELKGESGGSLDPDELFEQCCRIATIDDELELEEKDLLVELGETLGIGRSEALYRLDRMR